MARPPIFESYSSELPPPGKDALGVSKPAVFGFFFSIMFCLPVLSGLAAVILGTVGLVQIWRKQAIGRPVAIAAIVIGSISIVLWGLMIAGVSVGVAYIVEIEESAVAFVEAVANGEMDKARRYVSGNVSAEKLEEWRAALQEEQARAEALMWNFSAGDADTFDFGKVLSGPYFTSGQVQYGPKVVSGDRPTSRQVWLSLAREGDSFRVLDMTIKKLEDLRRVRPEPATKPAPQSRGE